MGTTYSPVVDKLTTRIGEEWALCKNSLVSIQYSFALAAPNQQADDCAGEVGRKGGPR